MNLPLFVLIRGWKNSPRSPQELRHSGILSLDWAKGGNSRHWLFSWDRPSGTDAIDDICARVFREKGPVRIQDVARVRKAFANRLYESHVQLTHYERRNVLPWQSGCFIRDDDDCQRLYVDGRRAGFFRKTIPIMPAPVRKCRWCAAPTLFKEHWKRYDGSIRCNRPDCRRLDYLENVPQSRGGIDLTPRQRQHLDREAWPTQKLINYLMLVAKEKKHGRKPTDDIRGRTPRHH